MKIPKLEYTSELNSTYKIVEVALANGLNPKVKDEFYAYVDECITDHISYNEWEKYMGDDL